MAGAAGLELADHFFKPEHPIRELLVKFFGTGFRIVGVRVQPVEELYDVEAAAIDIEVDVAPLKIGCHCLPAFYLRMQLFDFAPCGISDSLAVNRWRYKQ